MGTLFSRKRANTANSPKRSPTLYTAPNTAHNTSSRTVHTMDSRLLQENADFIQDLTECGDFLDNLDDLLSGDMAIPNDIASQSLGFDPDTLKSYIQALNLKAEQLRKIKLLLAKNPQIPNADLLTGLLTEVEPKCNAMTRKLTKETNFLTVAGKDRGLQNESAGVTTQNQPNNDQPGTSGASSSNLPSTSGTNAHGNTTRNTVSGGTSQNEMTRSSGNRRAFQTLAPTSTTQPISSSSNERRLQLSVTSRPPMQPMTTEESRGFSLIFSQSDVSSSSNSQSDDDDDSDDKMNRNTKRGSMCSDQSKMKSIEDWRKDNLVLNPKRINLVRSENILDSVVPIYSKMSPSKLQRIAAIKFMGEEGTDMGALTREFFYIIFEAIISGTYKGQKLMVGKRGHLIPNSMADGRFFCYLGRMIVHAVINGSRGLCGMSPAIVHYFVSGSTVASLEDSSPPLSVEDVDDGQLKELMEKYGNGEQFTDSEEESWLNWMVESNCSVNWRNSDTRSYVIQHLLLYFVFWKRLRQIQSLEEGLKSLDLKQFLIENPTDDNISAVFPSGENLSYTADAVIQILVTRGDDFNPVVWDFFSCFLKDLYNKDIDQFGLPDLIQFVTSSPYFPERIVVSFKKDIALPEAHACYNEIVLPSIHDTYPKFRDAMVKALQNGVTGFQLQ